MGAAGRHAHAQCLRGEGRPLLELEPSVPRQSEQRACTQRSHICASSTASIQPHRISRSSRRGSQRRDVHRTVRGSDPEHEAERIVDGADLCGIEAPCRRSETLRVNNGGLLGEHARLPSTDLHSRTKARRTRARRCRRHENGAQPEELIRLHYHRIARPALLMAASTPGRGQPEDLAADHHSGSGGARSAICSRISRISSRSSESAARRRTSSAIEDRTRRRAAASRNAVRTASESLKPLERTTSSAAAALSSRRT
jgi:hypothetical protein